MNILMIGAIACLTANSVFFFISARYFMRWKSKHTLILKDYQPVLDLKNEIGRIVKTYMNLKNEYEDKLTNLEHLERTTYTYDLGVSTIDSTTYKALFETRNIALLERELERAKETAKVLVQNKRACISSLPQDLVLNGKKNAAKTFVNREIKLRIRCFDNEVKAAIAVVNWNNINRLIQRIRSKFNEINDDSKMMKIFLQKDYLEARLRELRLYYEINQLKIEIKEEEREERQRIREEDRDQERVKQQLVKAKRDREHMQKLVERELAKISEATSEQRELLALHQKELNLLIQQETRAMSLAQQTRAGYVYVISNKASFGDGICKIGMTRRLDPNDRVKELGDASVPELFQVHAFIYTEDAPALENYFHVYFNERRVNMVNRRKEFFYVKPEEALEVLRKYNGSYNYEISNI